MYILKPLALALPVLINGTNPVAKRQTLNFTPESLAAVAAWFTSSGNNLRAFEADVRSEGQSLVSQLAGYNFGGQVNQVLVNLDNSLSHSAQAFNQLATMFQLASETFDQGNTIGCGAFC